jgi:membrane protease YdiL (CAAX protease family)
MRPEDYLCAPMIYKLGKHLALLRDKHSPVTYGVIVALETCLIVLIFASIFEVLGLRGETGLQVIYEQNKPLAIAVAIVIAPLLETALFQFALQEVLAKSTTRGVCIFGVSWAAFAISHSDGILKFVMGGMITGGYLSLTYYLWRDKGRFQAFVATWALHASHNAVLVLLVRMTEI